MTDWELIAKARGIPLSADRFRAQVALLEQMEAILAPWKAKIGLDTEPIPAFRPLLTQRVETE